MNKKQSDPIVDRLNILIKITMVSAFKDKTKEEMILTLSDLGIQRNEIADLVGTTIGYVDKVKHKAKKKQKKHKSKGKKKEVVQK